MSSCPRRLDRILARPNIEAAPCGLFPSGTAASRFPRPIGKTRQDDPRREKQRSKPAMDLRPQNSLSLAPPGQAEAITFGGGAVCASQQISWPMSHLGQSRRFRGVRGPSDHPPIAAVSLHRSEPPQCHWRTLRRGQSVGAFAGGRSRGRSKTAPKRHAVGRVPDIGRLNRSPIGAGRARTAPPHAFNLMLTINSDHHGGAALLFSCEVA